MTTESHESAASAETLPPEPETEKLVAEYEAAAAKPSATEAAIEAAAEKEDWAEVSRLRGLSHKDGHAPRPKSRLAEIRTLQAQAASEGAKGGAAP